MAIQIAALLAAVGRVGAGIAARGRMAAAGAKASAGNMLRGATTGSQGAITAEKVSQAEIKWRRLGGKSPAMATASQIQSGPKTQEAQQQMTNLANNAKKLALVIGGLKLGLTAATFGIEKWASRLFESNRDLARFDGRMAAVFARMDRQQIMLSARKAGATSGTTTLLGEELMKLRNELQPLREAITSSLNVVGVTLVEIARMMALLIKAMPVVKALVFVLDKIEKLFGGGGPGGMQPDLRRLLNDIAKGRWSPDRDPRAPNVPGGAGNGRGGP